MIRRFASAATPAAALATLLVAVLAPGASGVAAQAAAGFDYRVLATSKTSMMEKELNEAAEAGYRFQSAMGGETAGGNEVVAVMVRARGSAARFAYKLLATSRTSTMEKEMQEAAAEGFHYRAQTVFKSAFGGEEVVCILERDKEAEPLQATYRLLATSRTSTLQKEMAEAGAAGYELLGMTVGKTAMGGKEIVAIMRRTEEPQ